MNKILNIQYKQINSIVEAEVVLENSNLELGSYIILKPTNYSMVVIDRISPTKFTLNPNTENIIRFTAELYDANGVLISLFKNKYEVKVFKEFSKEGYYYRSGEINLSYSDTFIIHVNNTPIMGLFNLNAFESSEVLSEYGIRVNKFFSDILDKMVIEFINESSKDISIRLSPEANKDWINFDLNTNVNKTLKFTENSIVFWLKSKPTETPSNSLGAKSFVSFDFNCKDKLEDNSVILVDEKTDRVIQSANSVEGLKSINNIFFNVSKSSLDNFKTLTIENLGKEVRQLKLMLVKKGPLSTISDMFIDIKESESNLNRSLITLHTARVQTLYFTLLTKELDENSSKCYFELKDQDFKVQKEISLNLNGKEYRLAKKFKKLSEAIYHLIDEHDLYTVIKYSNGIFKNMSGEYITITLKVFDNNEYTIIKNNLKLGSYDVGN